MLAATTSISVLGSGGHNEERFTIFENSLSYANFWLIFFLNFTLRFLQICFSCSMYSLGPRRFRFTSLLFPVGWELPGLPRTRKRACALSLIMRGLGLSAHVHPHRFPICQLTCSGLFFAD